MHADSKAISFWEGEAISRGLDRSPKELTAPALYLYSNSRKKSGQWGCGENGVGKSNLSYATLHFSTNTLSKTFHIKPKLHCLNPKGLIQLPIPHLSRVFLLAGSHRDVL